MLTVNFFERVTSDEMTSCLARADAHLAVLDSGFRMLTNLTGLVSMEASCAQPLGALMDLCSRKGVSSIHRVAPDPQKDIGFAVMSPFHYRRDVQIVAHLDTSAALQSLGLAA